MIEFKDTKEFSENNVYLLFSSVGWHKELPANQLCIALANSTNIISAWDGNILVGLIRSMDDSLWSANIDCLLVRSDYQKQGIGTLLIQQLLSRICHIKTISVSPNDPNHNSLYSKFGFSVSVGSNLLQKYNG